MQLIRLAVQSGAVLLCCLERVQHVCFSIPSHTACQVGQVFDRDNYMLDLLTCIELPLKSRSACALLQNSAIASLVKVMREAHAAERKTLFVVGSYHIGKERAFFGAARAMGLKIWCHAAKKRVSTDTDNSCTVLCSCIGQRAVSVASCMPFQPPQGSHCILLQWAY